MVNESLQYGYRPLDPRLKISKSWHIEGQGLHRKFFSKPIKAGERLGVTHEHMPNGRLIRTPLGGFLNHSENPNCGYEEVVLGDDPVFSMLKVLRDIKRGEELTVTYRFYDPTKPKVEL